LIGPFFTINLVLSMKNAFGTFDQVMALTQGGPDSSTETVTYLIYTNGLTGGEYAYETANAVLFFIVLAIIAFIQLKFFGNKEKI
ncbi:carbohydrate ABC transporter permease, partial [Bifidobacterium aquikefiri]